MEWCGKYWCISAEELTRDDRTASNQADLLAPIVTYSNYKKMVQRGKLKVIRQGKGKGSYALIELESLPEELLAKVRAKYPEAEASKAHLHKVFLSFYEYDHGAFQYYNRTLMRLNQALGNDRLWELAEEYAINVSVIKAVIRLKAETTLFRKVRQGRKVSWAELGEAISFYRDSFGHTLGVTPTRFAQWVRKWEAEGYDGLISKKFGNTNRAKINVDVEELILRIARDPRRPYKTSVLEYYNEFLRGEREYYDPETGEQYQRELYPDLSERSIVNILEQHKNVMRMSREQDTRHDYMNNTRLYVNRKKPLYSLSMISLDDRDLPIKVRWTYYKEKTVRGKKTRVKVVEDTALKLYVAYDVASSAIVGYAFDYTKGHDLLKDCMRNMFRTLIAEGLGCPWEAQVEQHLMSDYKDGMMRSGALFTEVSFLAAENSRAKFAENFNRDFKYGYEKKYLKVGRFYALLRANRVKLGKNFDGENNNFLQEVWSIEEAKAFYRLLIDEYNNDPHPDQELYAGKSRWEVLKGCVHPRVQPIDMLSLVRYLGGSTKTSIRQGVLTAGGKKWSISSPEVLDRLRPMDNSVEAHWWEQEEGVMSELHIWQDDRYIEQYQEIVPFQVSKLERTDEELALMGRELARVAAWDKYMDEHRIAPIGTMESELEEAAREAEIKIVPMPLEGSKVQSEEEEDIDALYIPDTKTARARGAADL